MASKNQVKILKDTNEEGHLDKVYFSTHGNVFFSFASWKNFLPSPSTKRSSYRPGFRSILFKFRIYNCLLLIWQHFNNISRNFQVEPIDLPQKNQGKYWEHKNARIVFVISEVIRAPGLVTWKQWRSASVSLSSLFSPTPQSLAATFVSHSTSTTWPTSSSTCSSMTSFERSWRRCAVSEFT